MTLKPGGECKLMMYANNSWKKTWKKTFVDWTNLNHNLEFQSLTLTKPVSCNHQARL